MGGLTRLLEGKLKLKVNREKSAVARPWERKFLGFQLYKREAAEAQNRAQAKVPVRGSSPNPYSPNSAGVRHRDHGSRASAATFRVGNATSASAKPRPCWSVSISGPDVVYALLPVNEYGGQGRHGTLDCGSLALSHDLAARTAGASVRGSMAAKPHRSPFLRHARRLLRSLGTSFLVLHNWRVILPNRRVRTRTHGGVTGSDRLPMSISRAWLACSNSSGVR